MLYLTDFNQIVKDSDGNYFIKDHKKLEVLPPHTKFVRIKQTIVDGTTAYIHRKWLSGIHASTRVVPDVVGMLPLHRIIVTYEDLGL